MLQLVGVVFDSLLAEKCQICKDGCIATMAQGPQNKDKIIREGSVRESLPATLFRVVLDDGREILAHLSGKMRLHYIKVLPGDRVRVEMSPYDDTKGRIVHRLK